MITLNGTDYKLCLVDTNIISEMIKNPSRELKIFLELILPNKYIPCFSLFTILELRQKQDVYNQFLEWFSVFPCLFTKSHEQLLSDEFEMYPEPSKVNPILVASPGVAAPQNNKLKDILEEVFKTPENLKMENTWNAGKSDIVEGILSLKDNFPPKNGKYSKKQIRAFIEMAVFEQIARRNLPFTRNIVDKGEAISIDAFPSIKMMLFTVFYKFYIDDRKPTLSDAFDIIISAPTPYMDAVITENHQAEVIKKAKAQDKFLSHLGVFKLRDIRSKI